MENFLNNFDWDSFWMNVLVSSIFFILSIPVAIKLIPYFTIRYIKKKNKKYILRKKSSLIQEICEFISSSPYKDKELQKQSLSIFTSKKNIKTHRFVGISLINVLNPVNELKIFMVISGHFSTLTAEDSFQLLQKEKDRLSKFRQTIEKIIEVHSLHLDEDIISEISDLCLDIRSFDIDYKFNHSMDDLMEKGLYKREGIIGNYPLAKIYQRLLNILQTLINHKDFEHEVKLKQ